MAQIPVFPGSDLEVKLHTGGSQEGSGSAVFKVDGDTGAVAAPGYVQAITAAGAISLDANYVKITGPAASTYAVTLAAPGADQLGKVLTIEMIATTSTNAVTLALTNVDGGSAAASASFNAAAERLVLLGTTSKWLVLKEQGVTLSA